MNIYIYIYIYIYICVFFCIDPLRYCNNLTRKPSLLTVVWGMDETYQYMSVKGGCNEKLRAFIEGAEQIFGPTQSQQRLCPRRNRRRTILRQSLVQTARIHVDAGANSIHETIQIPPKLVQTTSARIVLTALLQSFESTITLGQPLLEWLRSNAFQMVLIILCVDQAAYNGLCYKILLCLQLILLPGLNFFLWLEPCGLHMGVRILIGHLDRGDHRKLLQACSRTLRSGKNHDRLCEVIPRIVKFNARYHVGAPPYVDSSALPDVKALLLDLMLLSERQRVSGAQDPTAALNQSRRKYHLEQILLLLNFTLLDDLFHHFCGGVNCCPRGLQEFEEKLSYHFLCLLEDGIPKFMATRFTKIFGTPAFVCPMQSLCNFGATAFLVAFKKKRNRCPSDNQRCH